MPTLSKLVAALVFGAVGYIVSGLIEIALPSNTVRPPVYFTPVNAVLGALIGWRVCGARAGAGYTTAASVGVTASITFAVAATLVWAFLQMMRRALRMAYDGPVEGLLAAIGLALEFGVVVITQPAVLVVLIVGGLFGGLLSEPFAERSPGA